jgi:release factor glutamine methyltransferase
LENEYAGAEYCRGGDRMLDLGCGSGVGTVFCAPKVPELVAVDINPSGSGIQRRIAGSTDWTMSRSSKVTCFPTLRASSTLSWNPPYIEAEFENKEEQFATSVRYLPPLFSQVNEHLAEDVGFSFNFRCGSGAGSKDLRQSKV